MIVNSTVVESHLHHRSSVLATRRLKFKAAVPVKRLKAHWGANALSKKIAPTRMRERTKSTRNAVQSFCAAALVACVIWF